MTKESANDNRHAPRLPLEPDECDLSFVVEEDSLHVIEANLSQSGIGFTTSKPLKVKLALKYGEEQERRDATLVWVSQNEDGSMKYGFHFDEQQEPVAPE